MHRKKNPQVLRKFNNRKKRKQIVISSLYFGYFKIKKNIIKTHSDRNSTLTLLLNESIEIINVNR